MQNIIKLKVRRLLGDIISHLYTERDSPLSTTKQNIMQHKNFFEVIHYSNLRGKRTCAASLSSLFIALVEILTKERNDRV